MQNPDSLIHGQSSHVNLSAKDIARFWRKVNKDGPTMPRMETPCWVWTACKEKCGYGDIRIGRMLFKAHRVSWVLYNGLIPHDGSAHGICVLHRCDNPSCVNPAHLFLGTHKDNMYDKEIKGRGNHARADRNGMRPHLREAPKGVARGERNGRAKLTKVEVIKIHDLHKAGGVTQRALAKRFGVGQAQISNLLLHKTWKHVV